MAGTYGNWAGDKYGDKIKSWKWDWRDDRIMDWINNYVKFISRGTYGNVDRQHAIKTKRLRRSLAWNTWAASGGDAQVFEARYIYYTKFVDLAVGRGEPMNGVLPPYIPQPKWGPISVPNRVRKAKPTAVTELRRQAAKFETMARKEFSFVGTVFMIYAMGNNKECAAAVNRAIAWASHQDSFDR